MLRVSEDVLLENVEHLVRLLSRHMLCYDEGHEEEVEFRDSQVCTAKERKGN